MTNSSDSFEARLTQAREASDRLRTAIASVIVGQTARLDIDIDTGIR